MLPSIEEFFSEHKIGSVCVSASGESIAWVSSSEHGASIYCLSTSQSDAKPSMLFSSRSPVNQLLFCRSGEALIFSQDVDGNELYQYFRLDFEVVGNGFDFKRIIPLTSNPSSTYLFAGQSRVDLNCLFFMGDHDGQAQLDVYMCYQDTQIFEKLEDNQCNFHNLLFSPFDGRPSAGVTRTADSEHALFVRDKNTLDWVTLILTSANNPIELLALAPSNTGAYFTMVGEEQKVSALYHVCFTTHNITLIHNDPLHRSDVHAVHFSDEGVVLSVSYYYGHLEVYFLDERLQRAHQWITAHFDHKVEITFITEMRNNQCVVAVASDLSTTKYYVYCANQQQFELVLDTNTLDPSYMRPREVVTYKAEDGEDILAYITLPDARQKCPAVVLPHGGPWVRDYWTLDSDYFNKIAQFLANRGYAVIQPNYRSSVGFGGDFNKKGDRQWGTGKVQNDINQAAMYLIEHDIALPGHIAILGASFGGYAALCGVTFSPDLYAAGISMCGPCDLNTLIGSFPDYYRPYLTQWFDAIGDPQCEMDVEDMISRSPLHFVDRITSPLLLIQGAQDPRVTKQQSDMIFRALAQKGKPVEYLLASDEGHGFSKHVNELASIAMIETFLGRWLGGRVNTEMSDGLKHRLDSLRVSLQDIDDDAMDDRDHNCKLALSLSV